METQEGLLVKTVLLQERPMMLSFMLLENGKTMTECIIKDRYLSKYIFRLPNKKYFLQVSGKRNKRNQLVVKHITIENIDEYIKIIGTPE